VSFCSNGVIEYAKAHEKIKCAFLAFQKDAGQIYPGWKDKLGYSGESSVQTATFDWKKKAAAAAFLGSVHVKPCQDERLQTMTVVALMLALQTVGLALLACSWCCKRGRWSGRLSRAM
jgi:hypothetical protein